MSTDALDLPLLKSYCPSLTLLGLSDGALTEIANRNTWVETPTRSLDMWVDVLDVPAITHYDYHGAAADVWDLQVNALIQAIDALDGTADIGVVVSKSTGNQSVQFAKSLNSTERLSARLRTARVQSRFHRSRAIARSIPVSVDTSQRIHPVEIIGL